MQIFTLLGGHRSLSGSSCQALGTGVLPRRCYEVLCYCTILETLIVYDSRGEGGECFHMPSHPVHAPLLRVKSEHRDPFRSQFDILESSYPEKEYRGNNNDRNICTQVDWVTRPRQRLCSRFAARSSSLDSSVSTLQTVGPI